MSLLMFYIFSIGAGILIFLFAIKGIKKQP